MNIDNSEKAQEILRNVYGDKADSIYESIINLLGKYEDIKKCEEDLG